MAVHKLTPKTADPYTGMQNSYLAWHFVDEEALDVFAAMKWLQFYTGWTYHLSADLNDPLAQQVVLTRQIYVDQPMVTVVVKNTQWFTFDNGMVNALDDAFVTANYDAEDYTLPPNPPPPQQTNVINNIPDPNIPAPTMVGGAQPVPFPTQ
jgi:hypothetical protein